MPRKPRIHYRHAFYHVMLRGNNRQRVFHQDADYRDFLECTKIASEKYGALTHLYCLMTNHIHMTMEVADVPISKIIQSIGTTYAKLYNKRHQHIGHVFQGRFKSKLVHDDQYLLELCYYIHMNPVKANMCQSPNDYPFSSHHAYMNKNSDSYVCVNHISGMLAELGIPYPHFIAQYKQDDTKTSFCGYDNVGDLQINGMGTSNKSECQMLVLEHIPFEQLARVICHHMDVDMKDLSDDPRTRKSIFARCMIAYYAHYHAKFTLNDIANYFCVRPDNISKSMHKCLKLAKIDSKVGNTMKMLERKLAMSDTSKMRL